MTTFRVLHSTDPQFTEAVRSAIERTLFFPADVDGKFVREIIQMPFGFRTNPPTR
jgi:hypothetical protein